MSAINRIKRIYEANGIRTVSGEGGRPFGLEKYGKALYVAWEYQHRAALGDANVALKDLAAREGVSSRFAQHIWTVVNSKSLGYPSNEVAARWQKLPALVPPKPPRARNARRSRNTSPPGPAGSSPAAT